MSKRIFVPLLLLFLAGALLVIPGTSRAESLNTVDLYTTNWCPYCKKAEAFLKSNNIAYTNYDIEQDKVAAERKRQIDRRKGVPLAVINGQVIYGFSEKLYRTALGLDE